jgi:hypothetical protein
MNSFSATFQCSQEAPAEPAAQSTATFSGSVLMKLLCFAIIGALILVVQAEAKTSQSTGHEDATEYATSNPPSSPSGTIAVINQGNSYDEHCGAKNKPKDYLRRVFAPENLPNLLLFAVGTAGVIVGVCTLLQIGRQTDALIRGQSPYLAAHPRGHPPTMLLRENRLEFEVLNKGLTPAYDVRYESWLDIVPPPFSDFSLLADHYKEEVPTVLYPNHDPMIINMPYRRGIAESEKTKLRDLQLRAYIRIRVTYRDAFNPHVRYAEFGYELLGNGLGFLPKYNHAD